MYIINHNRSIKIQNLYILCKCILLKCILMYIIKNIISCILLKIYINIANKTYENLSY